MRLLVRYFDLTYKDEHPANPFRKESCWNCYKLFSMADTHAKTDPSTNKVCFSLLKFFRTFAAMHVFRNTSWQTRLSVSWVLSAPENSLRQSATSSTASGSAHRPVRTRILRFIRSKRCLNAKSEGNLKKITT